MNNKKDVTRLYSEVVQSCHYDPDPTARNQENKDPQRKYEGTKRTAGGNSYYPK